jgi:hypothetical protein
VLAKIHFPTLVSLGKFVPSSYSVVSVTYLVIYSFYSGFTRPTFLWHASLLLAVTRIAIHITYNGTQEKKSVRKTGGLRPCMHSTAVRRPTTPMIVVITYSRKEPNSRIWPTSYVVVYSADQAVLQVTCHRVKVHATPGTELEY